jgi:methyl-accepting chemotaxis protein
MELDNSPSRLDRIERSIENLTEKHHEAMAEMDVQRVNIESLHSSLAEFHGIAQEQGRTADKLLAASQQDAEHIRALVRIAEMH